MRNLASLNSFWVLLVKYAKLTKFYRHCSIMKSQKSAENAAKHERCLLYLSNPHPGLSPKAWGKIINNFDFYTKM